MANKARTQPKPPLAVETGVDWSAYEQNRSHPLRDGLTDQGNAELLVKMHGAVMRHESRWDKWVLWDGKRWSIDCDWVAERLAKHVPLDLYERAAGMIQEAGRLLGKARKRALAKARHVLAWAKTSESHHRIRSMLAMATSESGVQIAADALDHDPMLLNCMNGTIDLRTGKLRPHRPTDFLTKLAPVKYDPKAACPTFLRFLNRILNGDKELVAYLQRAMGYALTGDVSEDVVFVLYGVGGNGKTTLINTLMMLMGDYARSAPPDLLMVKRGESHPTEKADLLGARLVASIEMEAGKRLAEALLKYLSGGDKIKARRMREDFWEFWATHKFFVAVNHRPIVHGTDEGIWRRLHLVPFTVKIPKKVRVPRPKLLKRFAAEAPGILAWLVRGCLEWQRIGLAAPAAVVDATREYREEMDVVGPFLQECCALAEGKEGKSEDLYAAYRWFRRQSGDAPMTPTMFGLRLGERGFTSGRGTHGVRLWRGLGLKPEKLVEVELWREEEARKQATNGHLSSSRSRRDGSMDDQVEIQW